MGKYWVAQQRGLNAFLISGFSLLKKPSLNVYFEILIDDINFHKKMLFI